MAKGRVIRVDERANGTVLVLFEDGSSVEYGSIADAKTKGDRVDPDAEEKALIKNEFKNR